MLLVAGALTSGVIDCMDGPHGMAFIEDAGGDATDAASFPDTEGLFDVGFPQEDADAADDADAAADDADASDGGGD